MRRALLARVSPNGINTLPDDVLDYFFYFFLCHSDDDFYTKKLLMKQVLTLMVPRLIYFSGLGILF